MFQQIHLNWSFKVTTLSSVVPLSFVEKCSNDTKNLNGVCCSTVYHCPPGGITVDTHHLHVVTWGQKLTAGLNPSCPPSLWRTACRLSRTRRFAPFPACPEEWSLKTQRRRCWLSLQLVAGSFWMSDQVWSWDSCGYRHHFDPKEKETLFVWKATAAERQSLLATGPHKGTGESLFRPRLRSGRLWWPFCSRSIPCGTGHWSGTALGHWLQLPSFPGSPGSSRSVCHRRTSPPAPAGDACCGWAEQRGALGDPSDVSASPPKILKEENSRNVVPASPVGAEIRYSSAPETCLKERVLHGRTGMKWIL